MQKCKSTPWDTYLIILCSLQTGLVVSEKLQEDFLTFKNRAMVKNLSLAENKTLNLEQLMQYQLIDVCLPIFNIDGEMIKAIKSKLLECFRMEEIITEFIQLIIVDMRFLWRKCIPNAVDRDQVSNKFAWVDYARRIFTKILQRHPNAKKFYPVNNRYDMDLSIKDAEHKN